jgi:hypothetical protein
MQQSAERDIACDIMRLKAWIRQKNHYYQDNMVTNLIVVQARQQGELLRFIFVIKVRFAEFHSISKCELTKSCS